MPVSAIDVPTFNFLERASGRITGTLVGADGVTPIPGSTLTTLTATLYTDDDAHTIINGRDNQTILGANGGSVDEFGAFILVLSPADNAILDDALPDERHTLLIQWTWPTNQAGKFEAILAVRNLVRVP